MSGLIPQTFLNDLLTRTDLVTLIESYVPLKKQGNAYVACCPFHNEKSPSFNVISKKQFYHCFGCGVSGNAISFVMNYLNQDFVEAVETLSSRIGLTVPREGGRKPYQSQTSLYGLLAQVSQFYQKTLKESGQGAIAYLQKRGISGEIAKYFQLGYAPNDWHILAPRLKNQTKDLLTTGMLIQKDDGKTYDRYRHRIMYPIHDKQGRIVGFGGRALEDEQKPKYLNSPETVIFQKSNELYGLHFVLEKHKHPDFIVVVEGYMDVIALFQAGITQAVATLGTATGSKHIQILTKHTQSVIFCFDGDTAGQKAAWRALESTLPHLNTGVDAKFMFLPEQHDPDSLIREEGRDSFLTKLNDAMKLEHFFFNTVTKDINITSSAGKSQLFERCKPLIQMIPDCPYKQLLLNELARLTRIDSHRLALLLSSQITAKPQHEAPQSITRTPLRIAIALLLQHPDIFETVKGDIPLLIGEEEGILLLNNIIQYLELNPNTTTAMIIETFRTTPYFSIINALAAWDPQVPETASSQELVDIFQFLDKKNMNQQIALLLTKSRHEGLNDAEKQQLQTLLTQKHTVPVVN